MSLIFTIIFFLPIFLFHPFVFFRRSRRGFLGFLLPVSLLLVGICWKWTDNIIIAGDFYPASRYCKGK